MIRIQNLVVRLPGFTLDHIDLHLKPGEFFTLLGPTGSGKTLILESVAGLTPVSHGKIIIDGRDVTRLPPEKRAVGIVYQDQALFPHLSVRDNITYGMRYHRHIRGIHTEMERLVDRLRLEPLLEHSVRGLSGGEKQRVAIARALSVKPSVLLLDEPISSLDPNFREEIKTLLKQLHRETGITILMVTHDFSEAYYLSQRTAVLHCGRIQQVGTVDQVFNHPITEFVADFVGMRNIFPALIHKNSATVKSLSLEIMGGRRSNRFIAIRPDRIRVFAVPSVLPKHNDLCGIVQQIDNHGFYSHLQVRTNGICFQCIIYSRQLIEDNITLNRKIFLQIAPEDIHLI